MQEGECLTDNEDATTRGRWRGNERCLLKSETHSLARFPTSYMLSHFRPVRLSATPWTMACQAPLSMGFSRQKYWSGLPVPSPVIKYEVSKVKSLSRVQLFATPWTVAHQAPPSMGFSRQEYWSGVPVPSPPHQLQQRLKQSHHMIQTKKPPDSEPCLPSSVKFGFAPNTNLNRLEHSS